LRLILTKIINAEEVLFISKKYFQDLLSQHFFFICQINLNKLFSSDNLLF